ncbi:ABC transporter permease subunit [Aestuariispira insulae]|uniref:ABC-2 type transport system permease protein n=1 Tax=Aestuariispira insulae TaxID=1461337 RepID=A0A3D9H6L0_9PROT|nr:ABC transporter permease subunit [Aestuariispira insulae]RED45102.1 ABC-2 type transport system permease protein [Aestuariispira insulae]
MSKTLTLFRREMNAYFATPLAYVFIVIFLIMASSLTFFLGNFLERDQADLIPFFQFHPWLFILLIPAISMRLWAEEIHSGTMELLLTLPVTTAQAVLGKFLAAWIFIGVALMLTFPIWVTVNYLGEPDNGVILASYIGSFFMAGGYLAMGAFISAMTKNQVIAFVVSAAFCFLFTASGSPIVLNLFSGWVGDSATHFIAGLSFLTHFQDLMKGVIDFRDVLYFASLIVFFLYANTVAVDRARGA